MPYVSDAYHTRRPPKCRWCEKVVKQNVVKGRNKGYCKTCGDEKCISMSHNEESVIQKKKYSNKGINGNCEHCGDEFLKEHYKQKWCIRCVPTKAARAIIQRYKISHPEYLGMLSMNKNCPICDRKLDNPIVDHDHDTGKVRGIICYHCNTALNVIEDDIKLQKALQYLGKNIYLTNKN